MNRALGEFLKPFERRFAIDFIQRALIGFGILWFGLHGIGFAMMENGSSFRGNPAWDILMRLYRIEVAVFQVVVFGGIAIGSSIMFVTLMAAIFKKPETFKEKYPPLPEKKISVPLPMRSEDARAQSPTSLIEIAKEPIVERPRAKEITPEELKEKAIEQILRGF